jgi:hypothetical protein
VTIDMEGWSRSVISATCPDTPEQHIASPQRFYHRQVCPGYLGDQQRRCPTCPTSHVSGRVCLNLPLACLAAGTKYLSRINKIHATRSQRPVTAERQASQDASRRLRSGGELLVKLRVRDAPSCWWASWWGHCHPPCPAVVRSLQCSGCRSCTRGLGERNSMHGPRGGARFRNSHLSRRYPPPSRTCSPVHNSPRTLIETTDQPKLCRRSPSPSRPTTGSGEAACVV